ncbi:DUF3331 domain-containing protein [Paraburkholderia strydomiana]
MNEKLIFKRALLDLLSPPAKVGLDDVAAFVRRGDSQPTRAPGVWRSDVTVSRNLRQFPAVVVGRLSSQTIAVRWSDPRSGYYGEQTWRASQSRKHAVCAATGRAIRRGDTVFKPTFRGSMQPFNRGEMILASGVLYDETLSE